MNSPALGPGEQSKGRSRVGWLIVLCLVLLLAALSRGRRHTDTEIVSNKVAQFARDRHEILDRMARKLKQEVPDEVKRFFEAAEAGNWEELDSIWNTLRDKRKTLEGPEAENLARLWSPILDT